MSACITGWAHSKFGVNSEQTSENMIADVVEKAIEHMTDVPARFFGLVNRGRIEKDFHADLVVFDPERINSQELRILNDLPGDSPRLYAGSEGVEKVFVNGVLTVNAGEPTEALSGTVLRSGTHTVTNKIPADA